MTSSNGNIFRFTGPLWGESTGHRWIPLTKAGGAEIWCFLWSEPEQTIEKTFETPVIWDAIALIYDVTLMNLEISKGTIFKLCPEVNPILFNICASRIKLGFFSLSICTSAAKTTWKCKLFRKCSWVVLEMFNLNYLCFWNLKKKEV